jgi:fatty acid desaturase
MAVAARINPAELFAPEQWAALSAKSSWRGLWLVAHSWGVIGLAMLIGAQLPWLIPLLIPVVACRQLGLLILMHDAAHGLLHPNRKINDWAATWFCSSALVQYRKVHLQHHRFAQQEEDPDLPLSKPFPITKESLLRKVLRDVSGLSFLKLRLSIDLESLWRHRGKPKKQLTASSLLKARAGIDHRLLWGSLFFLGLFSVAGYGWLWFALWLAPAMFCFPLIYRLRNIAEHAMVPVNEESPYRHARTTLVSPWERVLFAPYWVNYHCEHHMFTQVPCWNLPQAHRLLREQGAIDKMNVVKHYRTVLTHVVIPTEKPSVAK